MAGAEEQAEAGMGRRWSGAVASLVVAAGFLAAGPSTPVVGAQAPGIDEYVDLPEPTAHVRGPVEGSDGRMWATNGWSVVALSPTGDTTAYPMASLVGPVTAGPDGRLWVASTSSGTLYRVSTAGAVSSTVTLPPVDPAVDLGSVGSVTTIAAGPDGNVWYARGNRTIGRVTPGGTVTEFVVPQPGQLFYDTHITTGPDGALWFSMAHLGIGRVTTTGTFTLFPVGNGVSAFGVVAGPDDNIWFADRGGAVGRLTPAGQVTTFDLPPSPPTGSGPGTPPYPTVIAAGPDGNLWVGGEHGVWRVTPSGAVSEYDLGVGRIVTDIAAGPDGRVWFAQTRGGWGAGIAAITTEARPDGEFTPVAPSRVLDTRSGLGAPAAGRVRAGTPLDVRVLGRGGLPSDGVSAVVVNVTVVDPSAWAYLTVWPAGGQPPEVSNLNFLPGQTVPNHVTVAVGDDGELSVAVGAGTAHVLFDVVGFYADSSGPFGARYATVPMQRVFDTRAGLGGVPKRPLGPDGSLSVDLTGTAGVPATGVSAVVLNVTVTQPTAGGYLTVHPAGGSRPVASNLNFTPGLTVANLVTTPVAPDGRVTFYNPAGSTHVLADVVGYYTDDAAHNGGRFVPLAPARVADSRVPTGVTLGNFTFLEWNVLLMGQGGVAPTDVGAVVTNVTVTEPYEAGYLSVYPDDTCSWGATSNLNYAEWQTVPNQVITTLSTTVNGCGRGPGRVNLYPSAWWAEVIVDVFGYFTAPAFTDWHPG